MRIIPDAPMSSIHIVHNWQKVAETEECFYLASDTIEISDAEWESIWQGYYEVAVNRNYSGNFAEYLRALISLTGEGK